MPFHLWFVCVRCVQCPRENEIAIVLYFLRMQTIIPPTTAAMVYPVGGKWFIVVVTVFRPVVHGLWSAIDLQMNVRLNDKIE